MAVLSWEGSAPLEVNTLSQFKARDEKWLRIEESKDEKEDNSIRYDEFLGQVQNRAQLRSRGAAERVTCATLQTLGERLAGGEAKDFAFQFPVPLHRAPRE